MSFPALATWIWFVALAGRPAMTPVWAAAKLIQFGLPLFWWLAIEAGRAARSGRTARGSGPDPPGTRRPRGTGAGLAFGVAAAAAILVAYGFALRGSPLLARAPAEIGAKLEQLGMASPARFVLLALFYSLAHSFLEEYYWRWFVFGRLRALVRVAPAVGLSSLAFTAHHVIVVGTYFGQAWEMTLLASIAVAAGGAVWAWMFERTGSLMGPWVSHVLIDAAIMTAGFDLAFRAID